MLPVSLCFSSSCVHYVACFSVFFFLLCTLCCLFLWIFLFDCPFGILWHLLDNHEVRMPIMILSKYVPGKYILWKSQTHAWQYVILPTEHVHHRVINYQLVSDYCLEPTQQFFTISWWEQVNVQWDDDEVRFALDQYTQLDFYSASSLKQQSADRHVTPLWNVILIPSQPVFALSP
jgi:hypothetical protein